MSQKKFNLEEFGAKLKEMKASCDEALSKFQKLEGYADEVKSEDQMRDMWKAMYSELDYMFSNLSGRMNYLEESIYQWMYEHNKGHLPPIKDASKMEEALNKLGLGESFTIVKPMIFASKNTIEV